MRDRPLHSAPIIQIRSVRAFALGGLCLMVPMLPAQALAQTHQAGVKLKLTYVGEVTGVVDGGLKQRARYLDDLRLTADADLGRLIGLQGARLHVVGLNNSGGQPSPDVGTLQSTDNLELWRPRARLYEAWVEQALDHGRGSVKIGLYDVSSEFYVSPAAGLLSTPAFGVGRELAASGVNGPAIFPSTAPAARLRLGPSDGGYIQAAVVNARAGVLGEPGGVDFSFADGVMLISEAGRMGADAGKIAVGAWRYTNERDDLRRTDARGRPVRRAQQGAYLLAERALSGQTGSTRRPIGFLRVGVSDGHTTLFKGGWQAGVLVSRVLASRPASAFSVGASQVRLSGSSSLAAPRATGKTETIIEAAYADTIAQRLTLEPLLKVVVHPSGDKSAPNATIAALRFKLAY